MTYGLYGTYGIIVCAVCMENGSGKKRKIIGGDGEVMGNEKGVNQNDTL
jgi:hypothetical protein